MTQEEIENAFLDFLHQSYGVFNAKSFSELGIEGELKTLRKGEWVIKQGELAPNFYFFAQGFVRYVSVSPEGKEFTQFFSTAPNIGGSTRAMVMGVKTNFSIEVLDDLICLSFNWQQFFNAMKHDIGFLETYSRMMERLFILKEEREYAFVQKTAEQRYLEFLEKNAHLQDRIPLHFIASHIGITPVALSRIRKRLSEY